MADIKYEIVQKNRRAVHVRERMSEIICLVGDR